MSEIKGIVFSRKRPLQLDGCLRSFFRRCRDPQAVELGALVKEDEGFQDAYRRMARDWPQVHFIPERDFANDLTDWLAGSELTLFLVDDCVFWRDFSLSWLPEYLRQHPEVMGLSLRLGRNITASYLQGCSIQPPSWEAFNDSLAGELLCWRWQGAHEAWGYPLEVSSSVYRTADIESYLPNVGSPNVLENAMCAHLDTLSRPLLMSYGESVAYDAQINCVGPFSNRAGNDPRYTPEALSAAYAAGWRLKVEDLPAPSAVMAEIELPMTKETYGDTAAL